jgi:Aspartyl/Asparaginyl beta-hydroxylase
MAVPIVGNAVGRGAEVLRELARRRTDLVKHARGSLLAHLQGVQAILAAWGCPERVRLAGLLHSAYSTEEFTYRLFGKDERPRVRELVGIDAERLVFAFCVCDRAAVVAAAARGEREVRLRGGGTMLLDVGDLADILLIEAANLAEQTAAPIGSPSAWLGRASYLVGLARTRGERSVPVFDGARRVFTEADDEQLLVAYSSVGAAPDDSPLASAPVGEPFVMLGLSALACGDATQAAALGERACHLFAVWDNAWDKRLGLARWRSLSKMLVASAGAEGRLLDIARDRMRAVLERACGVPETIWAQLDATGVLSTEEPAVPHRLPVFESADDAPVPPRFARYLAGLRTNTERGLLEFYPGLRTLPWYDPSELSICGDLARHAREIAVEMRSLEDDLFQDEAESIRRTGRWSVIFLHEMGRPNDEVLARCPVTRDVLARHRAVTTRGGLAYFSCLDPHTRVAPHQGPTNMRLRCHLGLEVPDECGIRVGGVVRGWTDGECIVFDDSFSHEAWNDSDRRRVVLIVDVWHPDLSEDEVALLVGLQRYGAANGRVAERSWERNDAAKLRARSGRSSQGTVTGTRRSSR